PSGRRHLLLVTAMLIPQPFAGPFVPLIEKRPGLFPWPRLLLPRLVRLQENDCERLAFSMLLAAALIFPTSLIGASAGSVRGKVLGLFYALVRQAFAPSWPRFGRASPLDVFTRRLPRLGIPPT